MGIVDQPAEPKFRRLNSQNAKLQSGLFCHPGAIELFMAAGFSQTDDGWLELPQGKNAVFLDANSLVQRQQQQQRQRKEAAETAKGAQQLASRYHDAIHGGAKG